MYQFRSVLQDSYGPKVWWHQGFCFPVQSSAPESSWVGSRGRGTLPDLKVTPTARIMFLPVTQITEELTEVSDTLNISTILGSLSPFPKHFHPVPDFIFCCLLPYLVSVTSQLHITGLICKYESLRFYLEVHMVCMSVLPKSSLKRWNTNTYIPSTRMMALGGGALGRYLDYEDGALVNRTSGLIKETPLQDP